MTVSVFDVDPFAVSPHMPVYDDTQPYTWACSCGAKSRRSWEDSYDRTVAWIHHAERSEGRARTVPGVPGSPTAPRPEAPEEQTGAPDGASGRRFNSVGALCKRSPREFPSWTGPICMCGAADFLDCDLVKEGE